MFTESQNRTQNTQVHSTGWIEVITGAMFSGKTEELIRRLKRAKLAKQQVQVFKPSIDKRYSVRQVVSHDANALSSVPIHTAKEIISRAAGAKVVAIDEVQFFEPEILDVVVLLANRGKRVIVAGLDMDFKGKPFGMIPDLMAVAEYVTKLHAVCMSCGAVANYSYRLVSSQERVFLGENEAYEARCRACFYKGMAKQGLYEPPISEHLL